MELKPVQPANEQGIFKALLDAAPDATVIVDSNGFVQMVNKQTENLFGYKRDELIGQPVEILIPEELRSKHEHHREGFVKAARVRTMGEGIELNAVKKNGARFPVEISEPGKGTRITISIPYSKETLS